jgi:hypothetical protein
MLALKMALGNKQTWLARFNGINGPWPDTGAPLGFVCDSVERRTPGNLDPDEWAILRRVIDLIKVNAKGAELGPMLDVIETALRADHAKLIEAE